MAGITAAQAQARLDDYLAAEAKVLGGQAYELNGRRMTRANLAEIQAGIKIWNERATNLGNIAAGRSRARTMVCG